VSFDPRNDRIRCNGNSSQRNRTIAAAVPANGFRESGGGGEERCGEGEGGCERKFRGNFSFERCEGVEVI